MLDVGVLQQTLFEIEDALAARPLRTEVISKEQYNSLMTRMAMVRPTQRRSRAAG